MKSLLLLIAVVLPCTVAEVPCGTSTVKETSYIIGGQDARKDAWPWQVGIFYNANYICGGAIISPRWIVTAAHCVVYFESVYLKIVAGDRNLEDIDGDEQPIFVENAFHHPGWSKSSGLNNDVALIKTDTPMKFNKHVRPICLPKSHERIASGSKCYVTGWGQDKVGRTRSYTKILKQASIKVVSQKTCAKLNTRRFGVEVTDQMVCAGYGPLKKEASCHGDSGGPLSCIDKEGRWVLQGTVSWGPPNCSSREGYSVFARISEFVDWIKNNAKESE